MPPWLNKPDDDSGDSKGDDDSSCKSVTDHLWTGVPGTSDIRCEKCHTTPAEAAGLTSTHDMACAPVPELLESPPVASMKSSPTPQSASGAAEAPAMTPVPQHREPDGAIVEPFEKDAALPSEGQGETPTRLEAGMMKSSPEVAAILRFKAAGIDIELGRLHDLTCPAYHPEDTAKCHPFADLAHTDEAYFQRKAVEAACGPDLSLAKSVQQAWQAARVLRETDPGLLNDFRMEAAQGVPRRQPRTRLRPDPGDDDAREVQPAADHRRARRHVHRARRAEQQPARRHVLPGRALVRPAAARLRAPVPVPVPHEGRVPVPERRRRPHAAELRGDGEGTGTAGTHADARAPVPPVPRSLPHRPGPAPAAAGEPRSTRSGRQGRGPRREAAVEPATRSSRPPPRTSARSWTPRSGRASRSSGRSSARRSCPAR